MKKLPLAVSLLLISGSAMAAEATTPRGKAWWADIAALASDKTEGRLPGSRGYDLAAEHVVARFKTLGLAPAGDAGGFAQPVAFEDQVIDHAASSGTLIAADGTRAPVMMGDALLVSPGGAPRSPSVDAPLVFIGYGLKLPGYDDFAGMDLKGKIAVFISGGPADYPGPMKAANRSDRTKFLRDAGAVGVIALVTPRQVEIPWDRRKLLASQSGMYLADPALRETPDGFFSASVDPAQSEMLFSRSGHSFAEMAALADASKPVPGFDLGQRLQASVAATRKPVMSKNLVARLEGSDPKLKGEIVIVSAHLDHLGVGKPIAGDPIYNGAMDDASGVASVLDIAAQLHAGPRPKRSVVFLIVTAEEKGLLGSTYYAQHPTVPKASIVANLNFDMPLPLWPLKLVLVQGDGESTLGAVARNVAKAQGLALTPDPLPDRNSFTRTDQFSFVQAGIPALAFKFGFVKGTPEFDIEHDWRANRYHAPSDDLAQPG
ncbi:MAG: M28 family peptidase, partial [Sandarakinorhabdus sp.]|nr:M28 family peptidase [Sandarakinorhabdus sp.]